MDTKQKEIIKLKEEILLLEKEVELDKLKETKEKLDYYIKTKEKNQLISNL